MIFTINLDPYSGFFEHLLITKNLFIYLFLYLLKSYRSLIALILPDIFIYFVIFCTQLFLLKTFEALNGLLYADVPLRNCSLTQ